MISCTNCNELAVEIAYGSAIGVCQWCGASSPKLNDSSRSTNISPQLHQNRDEQSSHNRNVSFDIITLLHQKIAPNCTDSLFLLDTCSAFLKLCYPNPEKAKETPPALIGISRDIRVTSCAAFVLALAFLNKSQPSCELNSVLEIFFLFPPEFPLQKREAFTNKVKKLVTSLHKYTLASTTVPMQLSDKDIFLTISKDRILRRPFSYGYAPMIASFFKICRKLDSSAHLVRTCEMLFEECMFNSWLNCQSVLLCVAACIFHVCCQSCSKVVLLDRSMTTPDIIEDLHSYFLLAQEKKLKKFNYNKQKRILTLASNIIKQSHVC